MASLQSEPARDSAGRVSHEEITQLSTPNAKLMHRFYEPLQLLAMLNADRGSGEVDLPADPQCREFRMIWRRFLDDLSWLCDNKHGGETVSAVAAQSLPDGTKYWLASKYEPSYDHLRWVLSILEAVGGGGAEEIELECGEVIAKNSILFSKDKIKNYLRFLKLAYGAAREELERKKPSPSSDISKYGMQIENRE